jgi:lipopolysaccharide transport system ATP-binding protein
MSHIAIRVDNLSKKYVISHQRERGHKTLCDVITERLTAPCRSLASRLKHVGTANNGNGNTPSVPGSQLNSELRPPTLTSALAPREDFWALKDVCFEIKQGEVVGVIGRNGAGKSTLLKILSRITEPTTGRIEIDGRAASLLEVGTGFHPELTGRENIYLNGAILGMKRVEIKRKFEEIVSFAEIEKFLDTPVKRYSSGMYVRLAFAVAAHLEPEILIVDEVLAVGDVEFQRKCLGKMQDVATKEGRTVLFVSHNLSAVQTLCGSAILLDHGCLQATAAASEVVRLYLEKHTNLATFTRHLTPNAKASITGGHINRALNNESHGISVEVSIWSDSDRLVALDLRLKDSIATPTGFGSLGTLDPNKSIALHAGYNCIRFSFAVDMLANGRYFISLDLTMPFRELLDRAEDVLSFDLENGIRADKSPVSQRWGYGSLEIPLRTE